MTRFPGRRWLQTLWFFLPLALMIGLSLLVSSQFSHAQSRANPHFVRSMQVSLDYDRLQTAAQPLVQRGVQVVVMVFNDGNHWDFMRRLREDNLELNSRFSKVLAFYVGVDNRYSEIAWGGYYDDRIGQAAYTIRTQHLDPLLQDGQTSEGLVAALNAANDALDGTLTIAADDPSGAGQPGPPDWVFVLPPLLILLGGVILVLALAPRGAFNGGESAGGGDYGGFDGPDMGDID